jgi:hypothetical protein
MLNKLDIKINIDPLLDEIKDVTWDSKNRCLINRPTGHWLYDSYEILPKWKNTALAKFLESLPFEIGEARLMKLQPGECYPAHADIDNRYHLNLTGNEQCFLIDLNTNKMHSVVNDGFLYYMDAGIRHTAVNFGDCDRIQLVIREPLPKVYDLSNMINLNIKFVDTQFNFRYEFDKHISPVINNMLASEEIGWFNPISETEMEITTTQSGMHFLFEEFRKSKLKFFTAITENAE